MLRPACCRYSRPYSPAAAVMRPTATVATCFYCLPTQSNLPAWIPRTWITRLSGYHLSGTVYTKCKVHAWNKDMWILRLSGYSWSVPSAIHLSRFDCLYKERFLNVQLHSQYRQPRKTFNKFNKYKKEKISQSINLCKCFWDLPKLTSDEFPWSRNNCVVEH